MYSGLITRESSQGLVLPVQWAAAVAECEEMWRWRQDGRVGLCKVGMLMLIIFVLIVGRIPVHRCRLSHKT